MPLHAALPTLLAAFLASLVEFVEALTIVLAVGVVRGWRWTLAGAVAAALALSALVLVLGPSLARFPLHVLQTVIGTLLLLFGLRWLRKAILRGAGVVALHDEGRAFEQASAAMRAAPAMASGRPDPIAFAASFKGVFLEGLEVVFVVVAMASRPKLLAPAAAGAAIAFALVLLLGLALHRPLTRVPENALKSFVGVLLSAFGTFWVGEGAGFEWPGGDASLFELALLFAGVAGAATLAARALRARIASPAPTLAASEAPARSAWAAAWRDIVGFFVDDGLLAAGIVLVVAVGEVLARPAPPGALPGLVLAAALAALLAASALRAAARG